MLTAFISAYNKYTAVHKQSNDTGKEKCMHILIIEGVCLQQLKNKKNLVQYYPTNAIHHPTQKDLPNSFCPVVVQDTKTFQ